MSARDLTSGEGPAATLVEEAAAWCERLSREQVPEGIRADFERWRNLSPQHDAAYRSTVRKWNALRAASEDPGILALRHEAALRLTRDQAGWSRTGKRAAAVAVLMLGAVLALTVLHSTGGYRLAELQATAHGWGARLGWTNADPSYTTAVGERSFLTLPDGSNLTLNTASAIDVKFTAAERKVILRRGQVLFEVAKDHARPFVVEARGRRVVAVGTIFDVRADGEGLQVTMLEGTVRVDRFAPGGVAQFSGAPSAGPMLTAGEQLTTDSQVADRVRQANADAVTSWRRGQWVFDDISLRDAIAEVNRYSERQIELADASLARLRLSGSFAIGGPAVFIEAITGYFPIRIIRADDRVIVIGDR